MSDNKNISVNDYEINIDLYSILKDIWKYAVVILLLSASNEPFCLCLRWT